MRCEEPLRRRAFFDPLLERSERVELVRSGSAAAVAHAGRDEEAVEVARPIEAAVRLRHRVVVRHGVLRRHDRIGPAGVHQQLAAVFPERAQIALDGRHERQLLLGEREVAVVVDCPIVPVRIVEEEVAEESNAHRLGGIHHVLAPALNRVLAEAFAPARPAGEDRLAGARILQPVVHLPRRVHLRRRQTSGLVSALARELRGIEMTAARVVDDAVLQAVERVARLDRRVREERQLVLRNDRTSVGRMRHGPRIQEAERLANAVVRGIAGDDAVVILGIPLRLGQRLMSA